MAYPQGGVGSEKLHSMYSFVQLFSPATPAQSKSKYQDVCSTYARTTFCTFAYVCVGEWAGDPHVVSKLSVQLVSR